MAAGIYVTQGTGLRGRDGNSSIIVVAVVVFVIIIIIIIIIIISFFVFCFVFFSLFFEVQTHHVFGCRWGQRQERVTARRENLSGNIAGLNLEFDGFSPFS